MKTDQKLMNAPNYGIIEAAQYLRLSASEIRRWSDDGLIQARMENGEIAAYYPFISSEEEDEPRTIQMSPGIAFGRPVLANTGIVAEVIAGRFQARDTIADLAEEYGVSPSAIEDCVRWELPQLNAV